jgi:hypothetical protein
MQNNENLFVYAAPTQVPKEFYVHYYYPSMYIEVKDVL